MSRVIAADMPAAAQGRVATYRLPEIGGSPAKHEPSSESASNEPSHGMEHDAAAADTPGGTSFDAPAVARAALKGVTAAGRFGVWLLSVADWIDRTFLRWRTHMLLTAAAFVVVAPWVAKAKVFDIAWLPKAALTFFALVCAVLMLARLHRFRGESGFRLVLVKVEAEVLYETLKAFIDVVKAVGAASNLRRFATIGAGIAVVLLAATQLLPAQVPRLDAAARSLKYMFWAAVATWIRGWYLGRKNLSQGSLAVIDANLHEVKASVLGLPCLVDCRDQEGVAALAQTCTHPLVRQLMLELGGWRPNKTQYERVYQQRLLNRLRTRMADADPQKEVWIGDGSNAGRVDLLLASSVIVEMKVRPSSTEIDRAVGQVRKYLTVWTKGPVLLLLCNADRSSARRAIEPQLQQMRDQGLPVVGVLARG